MQGGGQKALSPLSQPVCSWIWVCSDPRFTKENFQVGRGQLCHQQAAWTLKGPRKSPLRLAKHHHSSVIQHSFTNMSCLKSAHPTCLLSLTRVSCTAVGPPESEPSGVLTGRAHSQPLSSMGSHLGPREALQCSDVLLGTQPSGAVPSLLPRMQRPEQGHALPEC